jgi:rod shape determining protein RodA
MEQRPLLQRFHIDWPLLVALVILCSIGLVVLYSAGGHRTSVIYHQLLRIGISFVIMVLVAQLPPARLERWSLPVYTVGIILLLVVLFFGVTSKGAQRWLEFGGLSFQPSELMKLAVPMVIAWYFAEIPLPPTPMRILIACCMIMLPVLLIHQQPDLGTAFLVAAAGFSVLFIAGISWKLIAGITSFVALSTPVLWYFMHDYQKRRILTFLDPEQDPLGAGYHIIQSKIAIGSGGIYGKGWLNGTQSRLEFLPERSTDFIFSVFSEEFGFMGFLLLISVYLFIAARCLYIALNAQNTYGRLLGSGLALTFFVYVFINMGMVIGQLPVVGVPLPLVSRGGSSLMTLMIGFGMLMAINTHRRLLSG